MRAIEVVQALDFQNYEITIDFTECTVRTYRKGIKEYSMENSLELCKVKKVLDILDIDYEVYCDINEDHTKS